MTGSTCNIRRLSSSAVYWCESGSGDFSNAVNITEQYDDIILVSPVLPVTEGTSVTLGCKLRRENVVSNVFFYQNDKLIQNNTRVELIISAVLKSDQGFYRCEVQTDSLIRTLTSPQSWMAVKLVSRSENSSLPVSLIVGSVCGILLIILLLLLNHYRKSKGSCFIRSQRTNQSSATGHMTNLDETQYNTYAAPHDESQEVTYVSVELQTISEKGKKHEPEESSVYSEVKIGSAAVDNVLYAEVHSHNTGKLKKNYIYTQCTWINTESLTIVFTLSLVHNNLF
ncbi:low affinity immunoglobulin gamma Fc region receptor II-like isoform X2 [Anabas testudineus]|uniref:low affinity immunoglobulin gamma Fc region receptor II-like isoform X2 n=1 Tax=Anabas testudineus TaxID=64144 RepID=UPI000E462634|nr:low affinity immunoglobulin gamma Fc region receptor II-like isoform X2 [Anabas testudineus]